MAKKKNIKDDLILSVEVVALLYQLGKGVKKLIKLWRKK